MKLDRKPRRRSPRSQRSPKSPRSPRSPRKSPRRSLRSPRKRVLAPCSNLPHSRRVQPCPWPPCPPRLPRPWPRRRRRRSRSPRPQRRRSAGGRSGCQASAARSQWRRRGLHEIATSHVACYTCYIAGFFRISSRCVILHHMSDCSYCIVYHYYFIHAL